MTTPIEKITLNSMKQTQNNVRELGKSDVKANECFKKLDLQKNETALLKELADAEQTLLLLKTEEAKGERAMASCLAIAEQTLSKEDFEALKKKLPKMPNSTI